jgi:hypothetical protein
MQTQASILAIRKIDFVDSINMQTQASLLAIKKIDFVDSINMQTQASLLAIKKKKPKCAGKNHICIDRRRKSKIRNT